MTTGCLLQWYSGGNGYNSSVQRHGENGSTSRVVLSASVPTTAATPPKVMTVIRQDRSTPYPAQQGGSRTSPADLSPQNADSPYSASVGNSEIDDIIIDEILSLEDDQLRRAQIPGELASSYTNNGHSVTVTPGPSGYGRQVSNSAPTSSFDIEGLVKQELKEFDRDRRKKDIHNMIERRRRYNINDRIKELGGMLPKIASEDMKYNKGTILKASVDYIRMLQREREHMLKMQQRQHNLEVANQQNQQRIKELEQQLSSHGIPVPIPSPCSSLGKSPISAAGRPIKQEPDMSPLTSPVRYQQFAMPPVKSPVYPDPQPSPNYTAVLDGTAAMALSPAALGGSEMVPQVLETPPVMPLNSRGPFDNQPHANMNMAELLMMDIPQEGPRNNPLVGSDVMISANQPVGSQMSPDIQWDASAFSPEGTDQTGQQMDLS